MNIRKRIYRGTLLFLLVVLLAPMQDGCQYEKAQASGIQTVAARVKEKP